MFRLTRGNISLNYSFSSKDFKDKKSDKDSDDQTFRNGGRQDDLFGDNTTRFGDNTFDDDDNQDTQRVTNKDWYNFTIPWDIRMAYTITYGNQKRENEISSQSLMFGFL